MILYEGAQLLGQCEHELDCMTTLVSQTPKARRAGNGLAVVFYECMHSQAV